MSNVNIMETSVVKPYKQQGYCCQNSSINMELIELQSLFLAKMVQ